MTTSLVDHSIEEPLTYEQTQFDFAITISDKNASEPYFGDIDPYVQLNVLGF